MTVHDVAAEIIHLDPSVDDMKLNKLAFLVQGASLAWLDEPAFREEVQAWRWGPVVPQLYSTYRDLGSNPIGEPRGGHPERLSSQLRAIIVEIVDSYRGLGAPAVMDVTHMVKTPWHEARGDLPPEADSREPIPEDRIREYFRRQTPLRPPQLSNREWELADRVAEGEADAVDELIRSQFPNARISS